MASKSSKSSKRILLAISGGIASYKSCEIARLLLKDGFAVQVMMTAGAQKFVTALTFQALTGKPVATNIFDTTQEGQIGHIKLADEADLVLVAPASADLIAKAAHGIADDLVTTVLLATKAPTVFAPSMNVNMYENPITQDNIARLKKYGRLFIDPGVGDLACGWQGPGRLAEPAEIVAKVKKILNK